MGGVGRRRGGVGRGGAVRSEAGGGAAGDGVGWEGVGREGAGRGGGGRGGAGREGPGVIAPHPCVGAHRKSHAVPMPFLSMSVIRSASESMSGAVVAPGRSSSAVGTTCSCSCKGGTVRFDHCSYGYTSR